MGRVSIRRALDIRTTTNDSGGVGEDTVAHEMGRGTFHPRRSTLGILGVGYSVLSNRVAIGDPGQVSVRPWGEKEGLGEYRGRRIVRVGSSD